LERREKPEARSWFWKLHVVGSTSANVSVEPQLLSDMSMLASIGGAERDENEQDLVLTKLSIPLDSRQSSRYILN
jgi:hypothetical protein